jgi:hypothetical protein
VRHVTAATGKHIYKMDKWSPRVQSSTGTPRHRNADRSSFPLIFARLIACDLSIEDGPSIDRRAVKSQYR